MLLLLCCINLTKAAIVKCCRIKYSLNFIATLFVCRILVFCMPTTTNSFSNPHPSSSHFEGQRPTTMAQQNCISQNSYFPFPYNQCPENSTFEYRSVSCSPADPNAAISRPWASANGSGGGQGGLQRGAAAVSARPMRQSDVASTAGGEEGRGGRHGRGQGRRGGHAAAASVVVGGAGEACGGVGLVPPAGVCRGGLVESRANLRVRHLLIHFDKCPV